MNDIAYELRSKCMGCGLCKNICPKSAIVFTMEKGFMYPRINSNCIECHKCINFCPVNVNLNKTSKVSNAYSSFSKNDDIVKRSSSGGVFFEICKHVLNKEGVLFMPVFKDNIVSRKEINNIDDLKANLGSKYIQCKPFENFYLIKQRLDEDKFVLFSGTPCQVASLKTYLNKDYDKLVTVDIICHGVGSEVVFQNYIINKYKKCIVKNVNFRDKHIGWKDFFMRIEDSEGKEYLSSHKKDEYFYLYSRNYILRESCYNCNFKGDRLSDITIGDFWGCDLILGDQSNTGKTLCLINSEKGQEIINNIDIEKTLLTKQQLQKAIKINNAYNTSVAKPAKYDNYITNLVQSKKYNATILRIKVDNFFDKIKRKLKIRGK